MYTILHNLFKDQNNGVFVFKAFSLCHISYILLIIGAIVLTLFLYRKKTDAQKKKLIDNTIFWAIGVYAADFFLMPFSYGFISVEKLPFHLCTAMSIMCLLARKTKVFARFKTSFTIMGFIGAISYLLYPSGVPSADGYSYRIVQTVAYHGLMVAQCVFAIAYDDLDFNWKNIRNDAIAVLGMTAWAIIGNELYSGVLKTACNCVENCPHSITIYENYFNWFFVKHDCLYSIPDNIDVFISPFIMLFAIFGLCSLIRFVSIKILDYAHKK